jgi:hypothetical protein
VIHWGKSLLCSLKKLKALCQVGAAAVFLLSICFAASGLLMRFEKSSFPFIVKK